MEVNNWNFQMLKMIKKVKQSCLKIVNKIKFKEEVQNI